MNSSGRSEANGCWTMQELPGSETVLPAELVLLALGFVQPVHAGMLAQLGVALDAQGNVRANTDNYRWETVGNGVRVI